MANISWYYNRLRTMSIKEIGYRIYNLYLNQLEKLRWNIANIEYFNQKFDLERSKKVDKENILNFLILLRQLFPWQTDKDFFLRNYSKSNISTKEKEKTFPIFEQLIEITLTNIDWHKDPKTGKDWPLIYSDNIDIRDATKVGEVDYIWRINRCQHLTWQARSGFLNDNSILIKLVLSEIELWIRSNPYRKGVNWTSSMEIAIRCISWIIAIAFLAQKENLPQNVLWKIISSIKVQVDYINKHLSRFSSANNHLIVELTGLITFGLIFRDESKGKKWLRRGLRELQQELEKQTYLDGVNKEQSTHYHSMVLDCLLWVIVLCRRNQIDVPEAILNYAEKMCEFIAAIMDSNGHIPSIGDSDDGCLFWLADMKKLNNFQSQMATGAVLFNRSDFKSMTENFDEKSFWLLGRYGYRKFQALINSEKVTESKAFLDAGYFVFKSGQKESELLLMFDCGSLGYPSTAAHGHADALSIWLSIGGSPVLVDSGTYSYLSHPTWREYFRGTSAHNTVVINDSNQSEIGGPYIWNNKANSYCEKWFQSSIYDYVAGSHNGYLKHHQAMHCRRILFLKPSYWLIEDCFVTQKDFEAEVFFHFSQGKSSLNTTETTHSIDFTEKAGKSGLIITLPNYKLAETGILHGEESMMQGWISTKYGLKMKSSVLSIKLKSTGFDRLTYLLIPKFKKTLDDRQNEFNVNSQHSFKMESGYESLNLCDNTYQDDFYFIHEPDLMLQLGEMLVNAQTIITRSNQFGIIESIFLLAPSKIRLLERTQGEFSATLKPFYHLQVDGDNSSNLRSKANGFDFQIGAPRRSDVFFQKIS